MPVLYGAMLTAWSAAGVVGPQVVAIIKDRFADQASPCAFGAAMVFLGIGLAATLGLRKAVK
jgi:OFA family oxalate/formate antiporter-like MFS transporter